MSRWEGEIWINFRPEGGEGVSHLDSWGESIPGRRKRKCKCCETGTWWNDPRTLRSPIWLEQSEKLE